MFDFDLGLRARLAADRSQTRGDLWLSVNQGASALPSGGSGGDGGHDRAGEEGGEFEQLASRSALHGPRRFVESTGLAAWRSSDAAAQRGLGRPRSGDLTNA